MRLEQRLNSLIRAGRHVIDSDFDMAALLEWKKDAGRCVDALLDPEHVNMEHDKARSVRGDRGEPKA